MALSAAETRPSIWLLQTVFGDSQPAPAHHHGEPVASAAAILQ